MMMISSSSSSSRRSTGLCLHSCLPHSLSSSSSFNTSLFSRSRWSSSYSSFNRITRFPYAPLLPARQLAVVQRQFQSKQISPLLRGLNPRCTHSFFSSTTQTTDENKKNTSINPEWKLSPSLLSILTEKLSFKTPTTIQQLSLEHILTGKDVVIVAETGSGKTLCYLLPIFQRLEQAENIKQNERDLIKKKKKELEKGGLSPEREDELLNQINKLERQQLLQLPTALVVTPSRVLCEQVNEVCKLFGFNNNKEDILICTPVELQELKSTSEQRKLSKLSQIVIDEADLLLGDSFSSIVSPFLISCINKGKGDDIRPQIICAAATMPLEQTESGSKPWLKSARRFIQKFMPSSQWVFSPYSHQSHPNIKPERVFFFGLPSHESKLHKLNQIVSHLFIKHSTDKSISILSNKNEEGDQKDTKLLIFVNTIKHGEEIFAFLQKKYQSKTTLSSSSSNPLPFNMVLFHSSLPAKESERNLSLFQGKNSSVAPFIPLNYTTGRSSSKSSHHSSSKTKPSASPSSLPVKVTAIGSDPSQPSVMIATDIAARGIDFQRVTHVLMFDFPLDVIQYLHRLGRTGRALSQGTGICFVTADDNTFLVEKLKEAKEGEDLSFLFSRKRSLRRKVKRGLMPSQPQSSQSSQSSVHQQGLFVATESSPVESISKKSEAGDQPIN